MTFDGALLEFFTDTITVEPFSAETSARVQSFGASVTYQAQLNQGAKRIIGSNGREVVSNVQAIIADRVAIDQRSRVTLPSGFVPNQPPILGISPVKGLNMDHTVLFL